MLSNTSNGSLVLIHVFSYIVRFWNHSIQNTIHTKTNYITTNGRLNRDLCQDAQLNDL